MSRRRRRRALLSASIDWRDPKMPVIREYKMPDGSLRKEVDPDYESRYRQHLLETTAEPGWRDDPTYGGKK